MGFGHAFQMLKRHPVEWLRLFNQGGHLLEGAPTEHHRMRIALVALGWFLDGCYAPLAWIIGTIGETFMRVHLRYCSM